MLARVATGVALGLLVAWLVLDPAVQPQWKLGLVVLIGTAVLGEARSMSRMKLASTWFFLSVGLLTLACVALWALLRGGVDPSAAVTLTLGTAVLLAAVPLLERALSKGVDADAALNGFSASLLSSAGTVVLLSTVVLLTLPRGEVLLVGMLVLVWGSDAGGYFAGKLVGETPLVGALSPNKTFEGLAGQLTAGAVLGSLLTLLLLDTSVAAGLAGAAGGVLVALLALAGDLTVSYCKRLNRADDSSAMLLAQGGFLDKLDGLIYTVPLLVLGAAYLPPA